MSPGNNDKAAANLSQLGNYTHYKVRSRELQSAEVMHKIKVSRERLDNIDKWKHRRIATHT